MHGGYLMNPKVSVIMPVYNHEAYLSTAIESVFNQTFKDFELIIVDDGSTDKSLKIAFEYQNKGYNLTIIAIPLNRGISYARNRGVKISEGDYIAFLSSDDIWKPTFLEKMIKIYPRGITFCGYNLLQKNGGEIKRKEGQPLNKFKEGKVFTINEFHNLVKQSALNHGMFVNYSCILGERRWFEGENSFWEGIMYGEDLYHIIKISKRAIFTYLHDQLTLYRQHEESTTKKETNHIHKNNEKIFKKLEEEGII